MAKQTISVETKHICPLIKRTNIESLGVKDIGFFVPLPYRELNHKLMLVDEPVKESLMLTDYFIGNKRLLELQTRHNDKIIGKSNITAFHALARIGEYAYGDHLVCFRDDTRWIIAVASQIGTPWGDKKGLLFQNRTMNISQKQDGKFIALDGTHYVRIIFNSLVTGEYTLKFSDSRTFKARSPTNVPLYDEGNKRHRELSELSEKAHEAKANRFSFESFLRGIDGIVKILFKSN